MNIAEVCQRIKLLIRQILAAQKKLEDARANRYQKVPEAVIALRETVKEIAGLQITYSGSTLIKSHLSNQNIWHPNKEILWHQEFGLAMKAKTGEITPLSIEAGNFPVEDLASSIKNALENTLNKINSQYQEIETRTKNLEVLIKTLQNSREE